MQWCIIYTLPVLKLSGSWKFFMLTEEIVVLLKRVQNLEGSAVVDTHVSLNMDTNSRNVFHFFRKTCERNPYWKTASTEQVAKEATSGLLPSTHPQFSENPLSLVTVRNRETFQVHKCHAPRCICIYRYIFCPQSKLCRSTPSAC